MAYTYDDFLKAANGAGLMGNFSDDDLSIAQKSPEYGLSLLKIYQDDQAAETAEQHLLAQEAAKQLRASYSTAGTVPTATETEGGSFQYDQEDSYQKLLDRIVNREEFSYDHESDPRWSAYKKSYTREGERATADALAKASAATGGVPSSYAVTAASQAGDYYAGQLADIIPELYDDAYNQHLNEIGLDMDALNALQTDRNNDWNDYLQDYEEEQQKFNNALALYQTLGYMTPEIQEALGLGGSAGAEESGTGTGVTGSYSSSGVDNGGLTAEQIIALQDKLGVTADGQYGPESMAAADGLGAREAYEKFVGSLSTEDGTKTGHPLLDAPAMEYGDGAGTTTKEGVQNRFQNGKMVISGRLFTMEEVEQLLSSGRIKQEYDATTGLYRYVWVGL